MIIRITKFSFRLVVTGPELVGAGASFIFGLVNLDTASTVNRSLSLLTKLDNLSISAWWSLSLVLIVTILVSVKCRAATSPLSPLHSRFLQDATVPSWLRTVTTPMSRLSASLAHTVMLARPRLESVTVTVSLSLLGVTETTTTTRSTSLKRGLNPVQDISERRVILLCVGTRSGLTRRHEVCFEAVRWTV